MKKFLSAFLAVLMVLSMVATSMVTVFAADAEEVHSVLVSNGEDINADQSKDGASQTGWRNHKAAISLMELGGQKAAGMTIAANSAVTDLRFHYLAKETVDISAYTYVEFDLYVSDVEAIAGIEHFALELTSIGKEDDANEFQFLWDDLSGLKTGWNHVKFAFSSFTTTGTFDATKWNFVRFFAAAGSAYAKELVIAIDNFGFSDGTETPAEAPADVFDDYDEQSISVPLVESAKPEGWNWAANTALKANGNASISTQLKANTAYGGGAGAFLAAYNHEGTIDVSAAKTLSFSLYTDDAAVMKTVTVELEVTSGGTCDDHENNYVGTLDAFVEGGLKNGWNVVNIPLASISGQSGGGVDWSKVNFFRMYNQQGFNTADVAMTIALDAFAFCNEAGEKVATLSECDIKTDWEGPTGPMVMDGEIVIGNTWEAGTTLGGGWFMFRYGLNVEGKYPEAVDISNMKYIEFDFYVSDANALINVDFSFELTGEGIQDKNESAHNWKGWKTGLADGWNHVQWPLSWFSATTNGSCDFTAWNFLRMFNASNLTVGENGLTVAMKNVEFTTGKYALVEDETEKEIITFTPARGDKTDTANSANKDLVVKITAGDNDEKFFADGNGEVIYKIPVSAKKYVKYVTMSMTTGAQLLLQASTDGENWTTVYQFKDVRNDTGSKIENGMEKGLYTFDLTDAVVGDKGLTGDYIYIRIADSYTTGGWGGNLYYNAPVTFEIVRNCVPHEVKMPAYGTKAEAWNWATSMNASEGRFSVHTVVGANAEALSNAAILAQYKPGKTYDVSAADTFKFDLYISNAAVIKNINVELELTSGGTCDNEEAQYANRNLDALIEGGMKDGWNTVVLPLSAMNAKDAADWTRINYFRMYFFGGIVPGDGFEIAYDNLRFTKGDEVVAVFADCEPDANGWERDGKPIMIGDVLAQGTNFTENIGGGAGYNYLYIPGETVAIDVEGMKYFEFDWYVSDAAAIANTTFVLELTSSGTIDKEEIGRTFTGATLGLKDGWNHVKFVISELGDTAGNGAFRPNNFNTLRMFNNDAITVNGELTLAIANMRFSDDQAPAIETPANPETPDTPDTPDTPVDPDPPVEDEDGEYKIAFPVNNAEGEFKYLDPDYKANWNGSLRFADNAQFFQYKFDLEYFCGVKSITFAGNIGGEYHIWASANGKNWVEIVKNTQKGPAKAMTLDLSVMAAAIAETATLYIRIGDAVTSDGNGGHLTSPEACLTITYDPSVEQVKPEGPAITTQHEKDVFEMNSAEENAHLVEMTGKWNGEKRYADANAHFTYKYTIKNVHQVASVIWKAATNQELKLDISFDNKNWVNVFSTEENLAPILREYDLTEFLVKDGTIENATFYLKISDTDPSDGWGGGIHKMNPVTLDVEYTPLTDEQKDALEATATEHSIPLWGANRTWGDVYETDNENQLAGSGCISINLKGVKDTHAPSKKFDDVDATGMDSLEFDIYLSDLAILDHLLTVASGSLEICSGGSCDQGEKNYDIKNLANLLKDNGAVVGWNHVSIPLSKMAGTDGAYGPFDISKINYIRLFWTGMTDCGQDWIMKLDNFRMTDAVAKADADRVIFENKVLEENAGLIANIEALKNITEVNAENYSSVKDRVNSAKTAFEALSQDAQDVLVAKGYKRPITDAQKKLDAYKAIKDVLDANADLIAELEALAAYADAASITKDNYETVKAAVEAAQAKVDALDADTKAALADYIANIATAKAAVDAYVPPVEKKGCGGVLTVGAVATMVLAGAWVTIAARKKED